MERRRTESRRIDKDSDIRLRKFQVLYDLAIGMTADRSLDENLKVVADKTRELLGTETSYIALTEEPSASVRMHTVSGIRTDAFKTIRLPFGVGLGGLVAKTKRGYIIEDYLTDPNISRAVDEIVAEEGLVSGMAAPMQMGERTLGVLYVFNRKPTEFSASDLDTLFLIANLAAIEVSRKQVEETLRESEEKYRSVMEASGEPIVVYNDRGEVTYLNPAFTRVFGWSLEELLGRRIPYVPEESRHETRERIKEVLTSPEGYSTYESRRSTKAGNVLDVIVSASAYRDRDGKFRGMVANLRDITARKRAENALRESEEKYRSVMEASGEPLVAYDTEGKVVFFNPAFERVFGWTLEELIGKKTDYTPEENWPETRAAIKEVLTAEHGYVTFESRRFTKSGDILDVIIGASVYRDREGNPLGMIANLRDITARKKAEIALKAAHDELEQRVAERTAELSESNELLRKEIGERKLVEQALRESERRYRTLLDFVPHPIVVFDLAGRVSYLNPTFTHVLGWTLEEVRGKPIPYVPPTPEVDTQGKGVRSSPEGDDSNSETKRLTKDGRILDVSMRSALYSESGEVPTGEIVILRDITEDKRIARNNEAMLRISMALPAHPDLDELLDYVTTEVKKLIGAEGALVILLDEETHELYFQSASYDDSATQNRVKQIRFRIDEILAGEVIKTGEPIIVDDATECPHFYPERDKRLGYHTRNLLEVPLRKGDRIIGVLCAVNKKEGTFDQRDVDLLKMIESTVVLSIENARASRELKQAYKEVTSLNRAKDRAFHHLSHELKTPTSVLMTSLKVLGKKLAAIPTETWMPTMERARRNLTRILEIQYEAEDIILDKQHKTYYLLSLLLDQCTDELEALIAEEIGEGAIVEGIKRRVEEIFGPKELAAGKLHLEEATQERLKALKPLFSHRNVEIHSHFEPAPAIMIPLDPLEKVIDGLLKNAVENTPDQGRIVVAVRQRGEGAELMVRDFGVGITQDAQARVFEGLFATQDTMEYSSKKPFDFQAGGRSADLLRMKIFSERYNFKIGMESTRCTFIPNERDTCPGDIDECCFCTGPDGCRDSGGTTFFVYFHAATDHCS